MEDIVVGEETVLKHFAKLKVDKSPGLDNNTSSNCRVVDLLMKPYFLSEKSLFLSMWSIK
jgi:hypothetical protein